MSPFPFPHPSQKQEDAIADAAHRLEELREGWLTPSETKIGPAVFKQRTLANLYNLRPTWVDLAHKRLDEAVFATYGWPSDFENGHIIANLLALNVERERVD